MDTELERKVATEKEMREWCVALPKVELHAHLNGSVRNSTLLELAQELGDKGIIVFEDVKNVIMKISSVMEMKNQGVIGIDLSGNPVVGEWETYLPALQHAKDIGIPITIHSGEVPNRKEIQAVLDFRPHRLGRVCCLNDEEWKQLESLKIPVEICLTSNVMTGGAPSLELHHLADLYNAQHPLSLCTDDSGLFSTSLSNEYYLVAATFGLSKSELFQLAKDAVQFVFADDEVKKSLRRIFKDADKRLMP